MTAPTPAQAPNLMGCYAGFVSRLMAFVVDAVIVGFSLAALTWFVSVTGSMISVVLGLSFEMLAGENKLMNIAISSTLVTALALLYIIGYHVLFTVFVGQTPGKALLGLRVVTLEGRRVPFFRALLRVAAYVLSALPLYLGFLWVFVDDRRQAWHDKLVGTLVIYTWAARPDERFLVREMGQIGLQTASPGPGRPNEQAASRGDAGIQP